LEQSRLDVEGPTRDAFVFRPKKNEPPAANQNQIGLFIHLIHKACMEICTLAIDHVEVECQTSRFTLFSNKPMKLIGQCPVTNITVPRSDMPDVQYAHDVTNLSIGLIGRDGLSISVLCAETPQSQGFPAFCRKVPDE